MVFHIWIAMDYWCGSFSVGTDSTWCNLPRMDASAWYRECNGTNKSCHWRGARTDCRPWKCSCVATISKINWLHSRCAIGSWYNNYGVSLPKFVNVKGVSMFFTAPSGSHATSLILVHALLCTRMHLMHTQLTKCTFNSGFICRALVSNVSTRFCFIVMWALQFLVTNSTNVCRMGPLLNQGLLSSSDSSTRIIAITVPTVVMGILLVVIAMCIFLVMKKSERSNLGLRPPIGPETTIVFTDIEVSSRN